MLIGDLADVAFARAATQGIDVVLHQAAIPSVPKSVADPLTSNRANIDATLAVLVGAREAGVRRLVYAASSSAYGDTLELPKREDMTPNPLSPYALQKLVGEQYLKLFTRLYGLDTVSIRYFNVFGPRQDPSSPYSAVIALFVTRLLAGLPPLIVGDGEQTRDFTYIDNVVDGVLRAAAAPGATGRVINVATGAGSPSTSSRRRSSACWARMSPPSTPTHARATCGTRSRTSHWPGRCWGTNPWCPSKTVLVAPSTGIAPRRPEPRIRRSPAPTAVHLRRHPEGVLTTVGVIAR